jgi:hypothetical protein
MPATEVWNSAARYRSNWRPIRWQWAKISVALAYFSVGM